MEKGRRNEGEGMEKGWRRDGEGLEKKGRRRDEEQKERGENERRKEVGVRIEKGEKEEKWSRKGE